jgi:hypothetical protein
VDPNDLKGMDPAFYQKLLALVNEFTSRQGMPADQAAKLWDWFLSNSPTNFEGVKPLTPEWHMGANHPMGNAYNSLMDQLGGEGGGTMQSYRQVPPGENAQNFPMGKGPGDKPIPGKNLTWLAQDVGNRQNASSGMGDLISRLMMGGMMQQQGNPEYDIFRQMMGLQPQQQNRL